MSDPSQSSRFRALFEAALQDYQIQTGTALVNHPLAEKLQNCNSAESVTAVLQEQARAFNEFLGDNGRTTKSLKGIVSVLYTLSSSAASIGLVRREGLIAFFCISDDLFHSHSCLQIPFLPALPSFLQYEPCLISTCASL